MKDCISEQDATFTADFSPTENCGGRWTNSKPSVNDRLSTGQLVGQTHQAHLPLSATLFLKLLAFCDFSALERIEIAQPPATVSPSVVAQKTNTQADLRHSWSIFLSPSKNDAAAWLFPPPLSPTLFLFLFLLLPSFSSLLLLFFSSSLLLLLDSIIVIRIVVDGTNVRVTAAALSTCLRMASRLSTAQFASILEGHIQTSRIHFLLLLLHPTHLLFLLLCLNLLRLPLRLNLLRLEPSLPPPSSPPPPPATPKKPSFHA